MIEDNQTIKVFIGSGENSRIERKVLIHTIKETTNRPVKFWTLNGSHDCVEDDQGGVTPLNLPLSLRRQNITEFSLYRYLIPQICGQAGKAIYIDSDMICLSDIGALFDHDVTGHDFLALKSLTGGWAMSCLVINCASAASKFTAMLAALETGKVSFADVMKMNTTISDTFGLSIGTLDRNWNSFDYHSTATHIVHFTDIRLQPWKFSGNPCARLWRQAFRRAHDAGEVTSTDLELAFLRGNVRMSLIGWQQGLWRRWKGLVLAHLRSLLHQPNLLRKRHD